MIAALFELSFFAIFFWLFLIALVVGTAFDRNYVSGPKWYIIGVGFAIAAFYYWTDFTFFGSAHVAEVAATVVDGKVVAGVKAHDRVVLWDVVSNWGFWVPFFWYIALGLVYSCLEFGLTLRKSVRFLSAAWQSFLVKTLTVAVYDENGVATFKNVNEKGSIKNVPITQDIPYGDMVRLAKADEKYRWFDKAIDAVKSFVNSPASFNMEDFYKQNKIIGVVVGADKLSVEPKVDKKQLAEHAGAWTFLWPAYGISLIVGDLLTEFFRAFADLLASLSGRLVRRAFRDVFKV